MDHHVHIRSQSQEENVQPIRKKKRKTREQEEQKEMRSNLKTMNLGIFTIYLANIVKMVNLCHLFTYPFPFSFLVILEKI